jgi:hypothetical protein
LGRFRPKLPLSLSPARSSPPPEAQLGPPPARARAAPTASPAPHVSHSCTFPRICSLSVNPAPLVSPFPAPVIRLLARSPPTTARSIASPLTRSPAWFGALRLRALCPGRPVATVCHHRRRGKRRRCSPPLLPFPSPVAYKRTTPSSPNSSHRPRPPHTPPPSSIEPRHRALPPLQ